MKSVSSGLLEDIPSGQQVKKEKQQKRIISTMKKILIAMLISIVSITSFAQEKMVYDYKASIKRLDFVLALKSFDKKQ